MKRCVNCGREMIDTAKYCIYCNARQPETASAEDTRKMRPPGTVRPSGNEIQPEPAAEDAAGRPGQRISAGTVLAFLKGHRSLAGIIAAIIVVLAVILGVSAGRETEIDLAKYTEVQFSGYNGDGTARVEFDNNAFLFDLAAAMAKKGKISRAAVRDATPDTIQSVMNVNWEDGTKITLAADTVDYGLDRSQGLSNGDIVTLAYRCSNAQAKKYGIRFIGEEQSLTVGGLSDVERFDAFAGVDVTVSGPDGYGEAVISKTGTEELYSRLDFTADKDHELHNGDQVIVSVTNRDGGDDFSEFGRIYGKVPGETTKVFDVSGLTEYPTFDAFAGLSVTVEGAEPYGYIILENTDESNDIWFEADRYDNLSNGDEVTVRAVPGYTGEFNAQYAEIYGQVPEKTEIILQIQDLPRQQEETE